MRSHCLATESRSAIYHYQLDQLASIKKERYRSLSDPLPSFHGTYNSVGADWEVLYSISTGAHFLSRLFSWILSRLCSYTGVSIPCTCLKSLFKSLTPLLLNCVICSYFSTLYVCNVQLTYNLLPVLDPILWRWQLDCQHSNQENIRVYGNVVLENTLENILPKRRSCWGSLDSC